MYCILQHLHSNLNIQKWQFPLNSITNISWQVIQNRVYILHHIIIYTMIINNHICCKLTNYINSYQPGVFKVKRYCHCVLKNTTNSQTPSVLSAVRVHATCRVSMMTCTVSRSAFCRNTVMTTPISMSRLIRIFLHSVISPCCPLQAISAAETGQERQRRSSLETTPTTAESGKESDYQVFLSNYNILKSQITFM